MGEATYYMKAQFKTQEEAAAAGPVGANGQPMKSRRGETFTAFVQALKSLGYRVEWRVMNAADYGAATTRERLFIQARRGRKQIMWPEPTHSKAGAETLFGSRTKWKAAREVIDWATPSKSIFARKKPLSPKTMSRILSGLEKFGGNNIQPFLVILRNHMGAQSVEGPLPTLTAGGNHVGLAEPKPFIVGAGGAEYAAKPKSVEEPMNTVLTEDHRALVSPFLMSLTHGGRLHDIDQPVPTVTTAHRGELGAVAPYLMKYCSTGGPRSVEEPIDTITSRDRFGLVTPLVTEIGGEQMALDIHFRMLTPKELARAMSFPEGYKFTGTRGDVVKQIGNAVDGSQAAALCRAVLSN